MTAFSGKRVLILEDEAIIAMSLEDLMEDLGCVVIGPVARLAPALTLVGTEKIDFALLDVNLAGDPSYPIAEALMARDVPFVFLTGYGAEGLDARFRDRPVVSKPVSSGLLLRELEKLVI